MGSVVHYQSKRGYTAIICFILVIGWLVGCFGFNGPLRQYFSLYQAVSQREGERRERIDESKNVQTTPIRTYCKRNRPLPYCNQNCRTPRTGSLPSAIAPPEHPVILVNPKNSMISDMPFCFNNFKEYCRKNVCRSHSFNKTVSVA